MDFHRTGEYFEQIHHFTLIILVLALLEVSPFKQLINCILLADFSNFMGKTNKLVHSSSFLRSLLELNLPQSIPPMPFLSIYWLVFLLDVVYPGLCMWKLLISFRCELTYTFISTSSWKIIGNIELFNIHEIAGCSVCIWWPPFHEIEEKAWNLSSLEKSGKYRAILFKYWKIKEITYLTFCAVLSAYFISFSF